LHQKVQKNLPVLLKTKTKILSRIYIVLKNQKVQNNSNNKMKMHLVGYNFRGDNWVIVFMNIIFKICS
jgi:hypothetical protein